MKVLSAHCGLVFLAICSCVLGCTGGEPTIDYSTTQCQPSVTSIIEYEPQFSIIYHFASSGSILFAGDFGSNGGVHVIQVDPSGLIENLSTIGEGIEVRGVLAHGSQLFVSADSGMEVFGQGPCLFSFDISDPLHPVKAHEAIDYDHPLGKPAMEGADLFVSSWSKRFYRLDPTSLLVMQAIDLKGWGYQAVARDGYVLVLEAEDFNGIEVFQAKDLKKASQISLSSKQYPMSMEIYPDLLFVCTEYDGVHLYDASSLPQLRHKGHIALPDGFRSITMDRLGDVIFVGTWEGRVYAFDIADPSSPQFLGSLEVGVAISTVKASGQHLVVGGGNQAISVDMSSCLRAP